MEVRGHLPAPQKAPLPRGLVPYKLCSWLGKGTASAVLANRTCAWQSQPLLRREAAGLGSSCAQWWERGCDGRVAAARRDQPALRKPSQTCGMHLIHLQFFIVTAFSTGHSLCTTDTRFLIKKKNPIGMLFEAGYSFLVSLPQYNDSFCFPKPGHIHSAGVRECEQAGSSTQWPTRHEKLLPSTTGLGCELFSRSEGLKRVRSLKLQLFWTLVGLPSVAMSALGDRRSPTEDCLFFILCPRGLAIRTRSLKLSF